MREVQLKDEEQPLAVYRYDANGRRIAKTRLIGSDAESTLFVYDGWNVIQEWQNSAASSAASAATGLELHAYLVWGEDLSGSLQGAGGVGCLLMRAASDGISYFHYDANGNPAGIATQNGSYRGLYRYDAFGNVREIQGAFSENNPWRFSTKYWDEETGLSYYGYRYYDPVTGRWPSRDPIGEMGGDNLYASVFNDLVNDWDLLGMTAADLLPDPNQDCLDRGCDWKPKHNDPSKLIKNGCSNPVGKVTPNGDKDEPIKGASFKSACDNHDICYQSCGANKVRCDKLFLEEMRSSCRKLKSKKERKKCMEWATLYTRAVDALGKAGHKDSWSNLQKKNCECDCDCKRERM